MDETQYLLESEKDALSEFGNISMGSSATAISKLVNKKVSITTPTVWASNVVDIQKRYPNPCIIVVVEYIRGLQGSNILIFKESDARIIADLMMGMGFSDESQPITDIQLSAVSECMNQMMGSSATALSQLMDMGINISPPELKYVDLGEGHSDLRDFVSEEQVVVISFKMDIEELVESEVIQIMPLDFAHQVVGMLFNSMAAIESSVTYEQESIPEPNNVTEEPHKKTPESFSNDTTETSKLFMLRNLPIKVSAILGKNEMPLGDILRLSPGSVVELDRFEDDPIDIVVNGQIVAKGEVVLVDDQFGVRILDIITPQDREKSFK